MEATSTSPVELTPTGSVKVVAFGEPGNLLRGRPAEFRHHGLSLSTRPGTIDALLELGREPTSVALVPTDTTDVPASRIIELVRLLSTMPVIAGVAPGTSERAVSELFDRGVTATVTLPVTPQRLADAITATAAPKTTATGPIVTGPIVVGALVLDDAGHRVRWHDNEVFLPPKSFAVLRHLMLAHPRVVGLEELAETDSGGTKHPALVQSAISRARVAFAEAARGHPGPIETVHRIGYRVHA